MIVVYKYNEVIQMIRNNISTFFNTTNPRWPQYYFVKRSLKKYENNNNLVVETEMYFSVEPIIFTYLDNQYFIILS